MATHYTKKKKLENKKAHGGVWIIFLLLGIFGIIIFRVAMSSVAGTSALGMFNGMPSSDAVYSIAQEYVRPTLRSSNVIFSDEGYQFAQKSDSVYVIKSYAEVPMTDGTKTKEYFKIILKYRGGPVSRRTSWELLDLRSN